MNSGCNAHELSGGFGRPAYGGFRSDPFPPAGSRQAGVTLLELLLVTVIIMILAALALPVVAKSRARAKRIECVSHLRQLGVGFHSFAHDHTDRFPFQVPVKEGGTLEFVRAAGTVRGNFYFAYRHFQALSNHLDTTKLLICPADSRTNATTFVVLQNGNVSYFAGATANYTKPESLLSGDSNLSDGFGDGSLIWLGTNTGVHWTRGCHEYMGNILFAGGHVESMGNGGLASAVYSSGLAVNTLLPPIVPPAGAEQASASGPSGGGAGAGTVLQEFFFLQSGGGGQTFAASDGAPGGRAIPSIPTTSWEGEAKRGTPAHATDQKAASPLAGLVAGRATNPNPALPVSTGGLAVAGRATNLETLSWTAPNERERNGRAAASSDEPAGIFVFVLKPEQCWPCWLALVLAASVAAWFLGREVLRQRRERFPTLSPLEPLPPAQSTHRVHS